jgi:CRISPR-associated protein Cas2
VCSKYRMAWVLVFFDLPVGTPEERKAATNFRKDLLKDGYIMVQFSVYARPCGSADRVETQVRRLKPKIPAKGEVRGLIISDAQWGRMLVVRSQQRTDAEPMPEQMMFL